MVRKVTGKNKKFQIVFVIFVITILFVSSLVTTVTAIEDNSKDGETQTFQSPVKAVGKTIEVEVSSMGEVESVKGFIPGLSKDELKDFAENWFFELPEEDCGVGESWRKEIDDSTETVPKGIHRVADTRLRVVSYNGYWTSIFPRDNGEVRTSEWIDGKGT